MCTNFELGILKFDFHKIKLSLIISNTLLSNAPLMRLKHIWEIDLTHPGGWRASQQNMNTQHTTRQRWAYIHAYTQLAVHKFSLTYAATAGRMDGQAKQFSMSINVHTLATI